MERGNIEEGQVLPDLQEIGGSIERASPDS